MKRLLCLLLLCVVAVISCGCFHEDVEGSDWRTWGAYEVWERDVHGTKENVYVSCGFEDGLFVLIYDSDSYNVICEIQSQHGAIQDSYYFMDNTHFTDLNGDGDDELVLADLVDGSPYYEVFVHVEGNDTYEFDQTLTDAQNAGAETAAAETAVTETAA